MKLSRIGYLVVIKFIISFLLSTTTDAQNIKNEWLMVPFQSPPSSPLQSGIKTFRISLEIVVSADEEVSDAFKARLKESARLFGDQYSEVSAGADLEIAVRLGKFEIVEQNLKPFERTETKNDKTKITYTEYEGHAKIIYPLFLRVTDNKENKILFEGFIDRSNEPTSIRSFANKDQKVAQGFLNDEIKKFRKTLLDNVVNGLRHKIAFDWSFYPTEYRWGVNYVETSKKQNYDDVMSARDATKKALLTLTNSSISIDTKSKEAIIAVIEQWLSVLKESNPGDKKARIDKKVTQAILENIAHCYFFLYNFAESEKFIKIAKEQDSQRWQDELLESITKRKQRFDVNGIKY